MLKTKVMAALAAVLLIVACGSDSSDTAGPDTTAGPGSMALADDETPSEPMPSAGCGGAAGVAQPGVEVDQRFLLDGVERRYLVTTPSAHDGETPLPVVFDFHGLMEGADIHAQMSQYSTVAEEEGFVVVFPHGSGDPVHWDASLASDPNADLQYFDVALERIGDTLCIDESRLYATGLSYGAIFTTLLLCERSEVLAAAAPVAGLQDPEGCEPTRPVPIAAFHGTDDPILLFNGGVDTGGIPGFGSDEAPTTTRPPADLDGDGYPASVAAWAARNGCSSEPTDTELSPDVVHRVYDCPDAADVEFFIVVGGGHSWPSSEFSRSISEIVGYTTFEIDGARDGWEFMSRFSLG
jgi:polyhydroxybutyrate depolymerase